MYTSQGNRHQITIDGKTFWVDSNQEEALILWLEENGFHDRWRHIYYGLKVNGSHYTPDLELSVQLSDNMTHRAIVESKPTIKHFNGYIGRRMRGIARFYFTDLLLLYVHDADKWYRIDIKTGELSEFGVPTPGEIPINKLYKPWTKKAPNIHYHRYRQRLELGKMMILAVIDAIEKGTQATVRALITPSRKRRRRRKR